MYAIRSYYEPRLDDPPGDKEGDDDQKDKALGKAGVGLRRGEQPRQDTEGEGGDRRREDWQEVGDDGDDGVV